VICYLHDGASRTNLFEKLAMDQHNSFVVLDPCGDRPRPNNIREIGANLLECLSNDFQAATRLGGRVSPGHSSAVRA
jgi:hypothetical protein